MFSKINIIGIFQDHFKTLYDSNSNRKTSKKDIFVFFGIPLGISLILMIFFRNTINDRMANILAPSLSIFTGLLFNLLMLIFGIMQNAKPQNRLLKSQLLHEIYSNLSFAIAIALLTIILVMGCFINGAPRLIQYIVTFTIYLFTLVFIMTLLMILKRVHTLFTEEFNDSKL